VYCCCDQTKRARYQSVCHPFLSCNQAPLPHHFSGPPYQLFLLSRPAFHPVQYLSAPPRCRRPCCPLSSISQKGHTPDHFSRSVSPSSKLCPLQSSFSLQNALLRAFANDNVP